MPDIVHREYHRRDRRKAAVLAALIAAGAITPSPSPLIPGDLVIDISHHDGSMIWTGFAGAGVKGVIIRIGYGDDDPSQDDTLLSANVAGAVGAGIPYGLYFYSYSTDATHDASELAHTLRLVQGLNPTLGLWFDSEEPGTESHANAAYAYWYAGMFSAGYRDVGKYCSTAWYQQYLTGTPGKLWVADWGPNDGQPHTPPGLGESIWQYTSVAQIAGIGGTGIFDANLIM